VTKGASTLAATPPLLSERPVDDAQVPRMELREWAERFGLVAGVTTRGQGFNLGLSTADDAGQVMARWRAFRAAHGDRCPAVVLSHQVHGTRIAWHNGGAAGLLILDGFDGHATAAAGILLAVTVADCVPVYLAAPDAGVIALVHAGWRGVADGVLGHAVETLVQATSVGAAALVMHCGVAICGACYEVGADVASRLTRTDQARPARVDLRQLLAQQAAALGIGAVSLSPWCSAHDRSWFFSHRASGGNDGRMVAYLGRPLA